jgi:hypothetical protein
MTRAAPPPPQRSPHRPLAAPGRLVRLAGLLLGTALTLLGASCGDVEDDGPDESPPFTPQPIPRRTLNPGATALNCPKGTDLTYENFGASFLTSYCTVCHSRATPEAQRGGATLGVDFDTADDARLWRAAILLRAGGVAITATPANGSATGTATATGTSTATTKASAPVTVKKAAVSMPPSGNVPDQERALLTEWLSCGAPALDDGTD